jgi:hypothetical protein
MAATIGGKGSAQNDVPTFVAALNYATGPLDAQLSVAVTDNDYSGPNVALIAANAPNAQVPLAYGNGDNGAGIAAAFGMGYELTEQWNLFGKVVYTDEASQYQMDWVGRSATNANEEILAIQGGRFLPSHS